MERKRRIKDVTLNLLTYLLSSFSILILITMIVFIFSKGWNNLSFKMLTSDYYETPYFVSATSESTFDLTDTDDIYYSKLYGIGLKDSYDLEKNECVEIVYVDSNSPLNKAKLSSGENITVNEGTIIRRVQGSTSEGMAIATAKNGAKAIRDTFDKSTLINELYYLEMGGGIRGSLISTLYLILLTLVIVIPIGIIASMYLSLYAKNNRITRTIRSLIDMIAGVPSIIFGLLSIVIFIPVVSGITKNTGGSIITGALTLSVMLLPTVIRTTEEAFNNIPKGFKMASLALGASETQTTFKIMLPNAIPGILTSVILSIGRIIGESAALIFAIGTSIQDDINITKSSTTLSVHIWTVMSGENPNYGQACAISVIILGIVLVLNILVKLISLKLNRFEVKR